MAHTRSIPVPAARAAFAGLSALLVVGVIMGSSLKNLEPALRESGRESTHRDLTPARQFSATLAKAVRHLVGGDQIKPAIQERCGVAVVSSAGHRITPRAIEGERTPPSLVRLALLNLPPPVATA
jgi:hypothetical protein